MADGQILIDTRIRTDEVKQDTANLKKQLEGLADSASASAKKIDRSFDNLSIDDAAEGLGESFEQEARKVEPIPEEIEQEFEGMDLEDTADGLSDGFEKESDKVQQILSDTSLDAKTKAARIAAHFRESGDDMSTAMKKAWAEVKKESAQGAEHVKDKIEDIGEEAEETGDKIKRGLGDKIRSTFDSLSEKFGDGFAGGFLGGITAGLAEGAIDLLENVGEKLVDFGKKAIEASAEIQAANAQFSETFRGVEATARASLQQIADEAEILATRLQDSYTRIYAFLKTTGADTGTAMELSGRAMRVAADQAAYYDKSIEEVTETLQSFLKGNYENDAALGIAATETTRNTKANEKYAKSFQKLSESQKVDVLLSMVEAGNEASGALGQAAREADTWANVTGNLSEAWQQFLGVLGTPLIAALTPVLEGVTWLLNDFLALADELKRIFSDGSTAEEISEVALAAETTANNVQQLRLEYDAAREAARASLDTQIDLLTELKTTSDKSAKDIINNWANQKRALEQYTANMQKAVDMGLDEALVRQLSDGSQQSMVILNELVNSTDVNVQEINEAFRGVQESKDEVASTMAAIQTDMDAKLSGLANDVASQWGEMAGTVGASISEMQAYINSLKGKDVYVNVITQSKTLTSGAVEGAIAGTGNLIPKARSIPYLASGAVIPPNAPFAAVLGDQRNGTNLEAPEGLIRKIVREESGGNSTDNVEKLLKTLISTVRGIQVGDTVIGEAAARYSDRQKIIHGGY